MMKIYFFSMNMYACANKLKSEFCSYDRHNALKRSSTFINLFFCVFMGVCVRIYHSVHAYVCIIISFSVNVCACVRISTNLCVRVSMYI